MVYVFCKIFVLTLHKVANGKIKYPAVVEHLSPKEQTQDIQKNTPLDEAFSMSFVRYSIRKL